MRRRSRSKRLAAARRTSISAPPRMSVVKVRVRREARGRYGVGYAAQACFTRPGVDDPVCGADSTGRTPQSAVAKAVKSFARQIARRKRGGKRK